MKFTKIAIVVLFCLAYSAAKSQHQQSGWIASFNTFKIDTKWSLHFDAQLRSSDALEHIQTILLRPGINYHLSKNTTASVGYAFIPNRRTSAAISTLIPEHRTWQQFLVGHKWSGVATTHRLRLEQRFLPITTVINDEMKVTERATAHRLRYFIRNVLPLRKGPAFTTGFFAALQNEIFLNIANRDVVNGKTFDQNRLYGALGYRINKIDLEAGYLHQYTRPAIGSINNHVVQLAVYKRL